MLQSSSGLKKKRIKVVKCSDSFLWYAIHIGEIFEVEKLIENSSLIWVREKDSWHCLNFIHLEDIEFLD